MTSRWYCATSLTRRDAASASSASAAASVGGAVAEYGAFGKPLQYACRRIEGVKHGARVRCPKGGARRGDRRKRVAQFRQARAHIFLENTEFRSALILGSQCWHPRAVRPLSVLPRCRVNGNRRRQGLPCEKQIAQSMRCCHALRNNLGNDSIRQQKERVVVGKRSQCSVEDLIEQIERRARFSRWFAADGQGKRLSLERLLPPRPWECCSHSAAPGNAV